MFRKAGVACKTTTTSNLHRYTLNFLHNTAQSDNQVIPVRSTFGLANRSASHSTMPGGLSRLMDKGRHHFNKNLSPTDDAYLSCESKSVDLATSGANLVQTMI